MEKKETVLITGAAGFIGFHLSKKLLDVGCCVHGVDNLSPYYSVDLKRDRLDQLLKRKNFQFSHVDIVNKYAMTSLFEKNEIQVVVHLAAQPGVRHSITHPDTYINTNLVGFSNVIECCRNNNIGHLVYASSSSVYGLNSRMPFSVHDNVDHPVSLYAATKKANELMAHCYSHLYSLPTTGLRFFTVYGPWGRPDMSHFLFAKAIFEGSPIKVFNNGRMLRDFTYIDDIVEAVARIAFKRPTPNLEWNGHAPDPATSPAPYKIYNIGNSQSIEIEEYIRAMEKAIGKTAIREYVAMQPGDVVSTHADCTDLVSAVGFSPKTDIHTGMSHFIEWYRQYHGV